MLYAPFLVSDTTYFSVLLILTRKTTRHLTLPEIRVIHTLLLEQYGGSHGERDLPALERVLAQPSAEYFVVPLHPTIANQTAAYWFFLCQAFMDDKKRTATFALLTFLQLNGFVLNASSDELVETVVQIAQGNFGKPALTLWLKLAMGFKVLV